MNWLTWIVSTAALAGVYLNIRKNVFCFWIWSVTNLTWAVVDLQHGLPAQATLQYVYFLMSLYGIIKWSVDPVAKFQETNHGKNPAGSI
jgi:nicotinamide riboside transporter PnuC